MLQSAFLRLVLAGAMADGWRLSTLEEENSNDAGAIVPMDAADVAVDMSRRLDRSYLFLERTGEEMAWIFIVWQGDDATYEHGEEIVSNYLMALDPYVQAAYKEAKVVDHFCALGRTAFNAAERIHPMWDSTPERERAWRAGFAQSYYQSLEA